MIETLLSKKDEKGLQAYFDDIISKKHSDQEIMLKGRSLYSPYMLKALEYCKRDGTIVGDNAGIAYPDGTEFSDIYNIGTAKIRIPVAYTITTAGIFLNKENFCSIPVYPISVLYVKNHSFYKLKNIVSGCIQVDTVSDLSKSNPKKINILRDFLSETVMINSFEPVKIEIVKYQ